MNSNNEVLNKVIAFADTAHGDQTRKYNSDRYIVHPIRVMETCSNYTNDITVLAAAILHDVLEDTPVTKAELLQFLLTVLPETEAVKTTMLVEELTDVFVKSKYPKWNRRKRKNKEVERLETISTEAQTIKYADIMDNAPEVAEKDVDFAKRFLPEYIALLKRINKGNPQLYQEAIKIVRESYARLRVRH